MSIERTTNEITRKIQEDVFKLKCSPYKPPVYNHYDSGQPVNSDLYRDFVNHGCSTQGKSSYESNWNSMYNSNSNSSSSSSSSSKN